MRGYHSSQDMVVYFGIAEALITIAIIVAFVVVRI